MLPIQNYSLTITGSPPETYTYKYPAPGSPALARRIQTLLAAQGIASSLNENEAWTMVSLFLSCVHVSKCRYSSRVCISLHSSLEPTIHMNIGRALDSLRDDGILLLGPGYTFHNKRLFSPIAGIAHPRPQHLLPLLVTAGTVLESKPTPCIQCRGKGWKSCPCLDTSFD